MRRLFVFVALFLWGAATFFAGEVFAQPVGTPRVNAITDEGRAPYRTQFISYDIRNEADAEMRAGSKYFRGLVFRGGDGVFEASVEIPALWLERNIYVRDEGRTGRYLLRVNGRAVGLNTDSYGGGDYWITPFLREGANRLTLEFADDMGGDIDIPGGDMERFSRDEARKTIEGLHIWSQPRIHIFDYIAGGHHDDEVRDAVLDLQVIVVNGFNMPETVRVGYDVYDPSGKLIEYTFNDAVIPGRGCDTVRFYNKIMHTEKFQYSARNPALYRVVLSLRHEGRNTEYIPVRVAFGAGKLLEGLVERFREGDVPAGTVFMTSPQSRSDHDKYEREGRLVVDRAAVECDPRGDSRALDGGTVANDPSYLLRFLDRQQAMYFRNRNRANVIGWSLGGESGNGYNMYKSYQWLKEVDPLRPVVYPGAEGEWNTDLQ